MARRLFSDRREQRALLLLRGAELSGVLPEALDKFSGVTSTWQFPRRKILYGARDASSAAHVRVDANSSSACEVPPMRLHVMYTRRCTLIAVVFWSLPQHRGFLGRDIGRGPQSNVTTNQDAASARNAI